MTATPAAGHDLTHAQQALWFLQQLAPDSSAYNVSWAVNLHFDVDVEALAAAVRRTVSAHSVLNCVFRSSGGEVRRHPGSAAGVSFALAVHDLDLDEQGVRRFALDLTQRPFRLDRELPVRVALLRRSGGADVLLLAAHHIVMDNLSELLVFREILARYAAISSGADHLAPVETEADFDDFVRLQQQFLESPRAGSARTYWQDVLARIPDSAGLPTDLPRPAAYRFAGSEVVFDLPTEVQSQVVAAASAQNATVFAYLFSAFQLLLYGFSGHTDLVVGYPVALRSGRRFHKSIGYFVNTLPFHARIEPDASFNALVRRTGEQLWRGLMHRDYPFALMPRLANATRDASRAGLISVMFTMNAGDPTDPLTARLLSGDRVEHTGLELSEYYLPRQQGQFDLTLQVVRHGTTARAYLKYNTSLFIEETIRGLADDYVELLRSAACGALPPRLRDIRNSLAGGQRRKRQPWPEMRPVQ